MNKTITGILFAGLLTTNSAAQNSDLSMAVVRWDESPKTHQSTPLPESAEGHFSKYFLRNEEIALPAPDFTSVRYSRRNSANVRLPAQHGAIINIILYTNRDQYK
ncbi:MAG: hypothetical protein ACP5N3_06490 [Candidatus Nanoarchaeia archaeon]